MKTGVFIVFRLSLHVHEESWDLKSTSVGHFHHSITNLYDV